MEYFPTSIYCHTTASNHSSVATPTASVCHLQYVVWWYTMVACSQSAGLLSMYSAILISILVGSVLSTSPVTWLMNVSHVSQVTTSWPCPHSKSFCSVLACDRQNTLYYRPLPTAAAAYSELHSVNTLYYRPLPTAAAAYSELHREHTLLQYIGYLLQQLPTVSYIVNTLYYRPLPTAGWPTVSYMCHTLLRPTDYSGGHEWTHSLQAATYCSSCLHLVNRLL